jgi:hypothetical protein
LSVLISLNNARHSQTASYDAAVSSGSDGLLSFARVSHQSHAFLLSARPLALGRNSLNTPALATMDFRVLKYFPFGAVKRLDVVEEFFDLINSANVSQINLVFGSGSTPIPGFKQPIAGTGARQIQFSLDFES